MALHLDLSDSGAKLARARIHLKSILRERWDAYKGTVYRVRRSEIDEDGWISIFLTPTEFAKNDLSVTAGDLVHNLRCALDYIVTALVDKSNATITTKHQFPIFTYEAGYRDRVGDKTFAKNPGLLANVKYGLDLFWTVQPFHRKPDPFDDPLFFVHELSNSDKHRALALALPHAFGSDIRVEHDGVILDDRSMLPGADWKPNEEREVRRIRFARPYPNKIETEGEIAVTVQFAARPIGQNGIRVPIGPEALNAMCEYVAKVIECFKAL